MSNYASKRFGLKINNFNGYIVPSFVTAFSMNYLRANFIPQQNDIFICCSSKSGTNWTLKWCIEIMKHSEKQNCHSFYNHGIWRNIPWIEQFVSDQGIPKFTQHCHSLNNTLRFWSTHCPLHITPYNNEYKKHKIIYLCRNPKDVVLSCYPFYYSHPWLEMNTNTTFNDFFEMFVAGLIPFDSYFKHVYHWYNEYKYNNENKNILWLYYEDMRSNPLNELKKVAKLLGKENDLNDDAYDSILQKSDILEMRKYAEIGLVRYKPEFFDRGGKVDGWKTELNQKQIDIMDDMIRSHFLGTEIKYFQDLL